MKPCSKNRKAIAWLAVNALATEQAEAIRAHLRACPGCHDYWQQIVAIAQQFETADILPEVRTDERFHRRLVRRISEHQKRPAPVAAIDFFREWLLDWRTVTSTTVVMIFVLVCIVVPKSRRDIPPRV